MTLNRNGDAVSLETEVLVTGGGPVGSDGHVAWRVDAIPADVNTLLARVAGN
jgi:hypothetical protein